MGKDENDIAALIRAAAPDLPDERITAIAQRIQRDLGGSYLKKAPAGGKVARLGAALASGASVVQAFAEAGVSRGYGYKLLSRRWAR